MHKTMIKYHVMFCKFGKRIFCWSLTKFMECLWKISLPNQHDIYKLPLFRWILQCQSTHLAYKSLCKPSVKKIEIIGTPTTSTFQYTSHIHINWISRVSLATPIYVANFHVIEPIGRSGLIHRYKCCAQIRTRLAVWIIKSCYMNAPNHNQGCY